MVRSRTAERHHDPVAKVRAALNCMHPARIGHVLLNHLGNRDGRHLVGEALGLADPAGERVARGSNIEPDLTPGEILRIEAPQEQVAIGDGWLGAACGIRGGTGFGARAFGADADPAQLVDRGDTAPTGADFDHFYDRDLEGQA